MNELQKQGCIDSKLKHQRYPTSEYLPCFYGLQKIHKDNLPLHPIVSSVGSVTYDIAKFFAFVLRPLVGNTKNIQHVQNSIDFVNKIIEITLKPEETIISYDVVGIFTSIPPSRVIDVDHQALLKDTTLSNRNNLSCNQICHLLHLCLDNTYFSYNGQLYLQCYGCLMGSPVSPIVSSLYVEQFEHLALSTNLYSGLQSWNRYVDDTFAVLHSDESDLKNSSH